MEQTTENVKPAVKEAAPGDAEAEPARRDASETITPLLEELIASTRSLEASIKVLTDTNTLILKKIYELESRLDASKLR